MKKKTINNKKKLHLNFKNNFSYYFFKYVARRVKTN